MKLKFKQIIFIGISSVICSCQVGRYFIYNFADINDHKKFLSRPLEKSPVQFNFYNTNSGKFPKEINNIF